MHYNTLNLNMTCIVCGADQFTVIVSRRGWRVGRCMTCGLVQVVPMPTEKKIASLYHEDMDHFDPYIAQLPVHRAYFRTKIHELVTLIGAPRHRNLRLLDIGCAMGVLLAEAKKQGFGPTGIDISGDAVAYCRRHGLDARRGTVQNVQFKKNSFDAVTAFEILEHERDPLGLLKRMNALLKKDGIAVLTTPDHAGKWRKIMGKWWVGYKHPEHVTFWNAQSLMFLMKKAGFTDITVRHDSPRPFPLSFAFTRGADYFPSLAWGMKPIGALLDRFRILNPINPWDDLITVGRK